jgi:hypothetical protein
MAERSLNIIGLFVHVDAPRFLPSVVALGQSGIAGSESGLECGEI